MSARGSKLTSREATRLDISRHAAKLFLERGVAGTSGDDIAAAAGLSARTIWRYFRSKESCVEPLFAKSMTDFCEQLRAWPKDISIEEQFAKTFALETKTDQEIADGFLIVRLVAKLAEEPELQTSWLMSRHQSEPDLALIIADRLGRSSQDFDIRLCAAAVASAIRVIDETVSFAAIVHKQTFSTAELVEQMAAAIRRISPIPFCDPVASDVFGRSGGSRRS